MTGFKNPLVAVGEALRKDAEIRRRQPLINPSKIRPLEHHLAEVVDLVPFIEARRNPFNNGSAA